MQKEYLVSAAIWCLAIGAMSAHAEDEGSAGEKPLRSKLFAGYSFVTSDQQSSLHGGVLALDLGVARAFTLVLDASKHFGRASMDESNVMFGPALFFEGRGLQPFAQALVGVHTARGDAHFGLEAGGGADVSLGPRWSVRGEADYLWSHRAGPNIAGICVQGVPDCFGSSFSEKGLRLSVGVVFASRRW